MPGNPADISVDGLAAFKRDGLDFSQTETVRSMVVVTPTNI